MDLRTWVTKDMGYRNYVLWSDETKINLFGSESHVNRKLSGRKKCGRKRCTTNRENRSLMRIIKQNRIKILGELHKEWTDAGVKASRATTHRIASLGIYPTQGLLDLFPISAPSSLNLVSHSAHHLWRGLAAGLPIPSSFGVESSVSLNSAFSLRGPDSASVLRITFLKK